MDALVEAEKKELSPRCNKIDEGDSAWEAYEDGYAAAHFTRFEILTSELRCDMLPIHDTGSIQTLTARQFYRILVDEIPGCSHAVVAIWVHFIMECVEHGQYIRFESTGDMGEDLHRWFGSVCEAFLNVKAIYGEAAASAVCVLALRPFCLYPWEMQPAARHWCENGNLEDIDELLEEGRLEDDNQAYRPLSELVDLSKYPAEE